MNNLTSKISHSQKERLKYIEQHLLWKRRYTSNILIEQFGISKALAHKDIALYKKLFPENIAPFDAKEGFLKPSSSFASQLIDPCKPPEERVISVPKLQKTTDAKILELILKAIDLKKSVELNYASSSTPLGKKRLVTPSYIANVSNRLHFRGYCHLKNDHRDFVIARCLTLPKLKKTPRQIPIDIEFETQMEFKLIANESLCEDGKKLVAREYSHELAQTHKLPRALFHYFLIDNNLPATREQMDLAHRSPWTYPLLADINAEQEQVLFGGKGL